MQAGLLNKIIEIYRPQTIKNDYGEESVEYKKMYVTRSQKKYNSGNRLLETNEIVFATDETFAVRIYTDINELDRIKYDNKFYRILSINKDDMTQSKVVKTELINE